MNNSLINDEYINLFNIELDKLKINNNYNPSILQTDNSSINIIKELSQIDDHIRNLEKSLKIQYIQKTNKNLTSINSKFNGIKLSTSSILNDKNEPRHIIKFNDGCLSVSNNYSNKPCDINDKTQHFIINHINNSDDHIKKIDFGNVNSDTHYPFLLIKSQYNGNCISSTHNGIIVKPCNGKINDQWSPIF